ncbi:MAG: DegV family protein [Actinomyces oris]|uniref:DegV family protein n=1 Tax=Actinomyces oris TaxID=544580 RepID=UPI00360A8796
MSLAVVTDSAACLTESLLRERAIEVVPLHAIPADNGEPATTSRPSVQELVDAYRRAASRAEEVLAIHISSALSGTMDNARIAAAQLEAEYRDQPNGPSAGRRRPQWLRVVDSGTSSGALGLAVLAASGAHDARRGAALAQASTARSCQLFVVDDLGRLARSGRIDRTTARLDGVLGIRPVLALTRDGIRTLETVRGAARARRHLIAQAVRVAGGTALSGPRHPADPVRLVIQGDDASKLALLETDLRQAMEEAGAKVSEVLTLPVDEATSTHVGPGALGIAVAPDLKTH